MSIVLSLTGQLDVAERLSRTDARDWLARAAVWFEGVGDAVLDARVVRDAEEKPVLLVVLHPASPAAEVRLGAGGRLRVTAPTYPTGPGYHIHLCDLFHQMAEEFGFSWVPDDCTDPTGYFGAKGIPRRTPVRGRSPGAARTRERCVRTSSCGGSRTRARGRPRRSGCRRSRVHRAGEVLTPLGPRTRAWALEVAADPGAGALSSRGGHRPGRRVLPRSGFGAGSGATSSGARR